MTADQTATALRELLAIVDIDATATLTALSLAQRELPRALTMCAGDLIKARFRFAANWRLELAHCGARLDSRSVNRQALRKQGVTPALIDGFIGDSAKPQYVGESDPFVDVLRIDVGEVSTLVNPHNQACLLTAPDHCLIDTLLPPGPQSDWPRTPPARPSFLRLTTPADLPDAIDASALHTLELRCSAFAGLRDVLTSAADLRRLCIHDSSLLESGLFDDLDMRALEHLAIDDAARMTLDGWSRTRDWRAIRSLRIHGLGRAQDNVDVLTMISRAPIWASLSELDLAIHTRYATLDRQRWGDLWSDREFALETLRLRYLDPSQWRAVWRGHFPKLRTLGMVDNGLGDQLPGALEGASLPHLELLDLRGNNLSRQALRDFALTHPFPNLRRVGIQLDSDVLEDHCDWNGAVVGRGPVPLTAAEIDATWLTGTGLHAFDG